MTVWLTRERVRLVAFALLFVNILLVANLWLLGNAGLDYQGRPLGGDFLAFWSAGWLAVQGQLELANGTLPMSAVHPLAPAAQRDVLLWTYPPPFLLLLAPLAKLAYVPAMLLFTALGLGAAALAVRNFAQDKLVWLLWLAAPATLVCVLGGQTGLLLAALWAIGFYMRPTQPLLAGFILGLSCIKPHFAALIPLFLLLQRDWRALFGFVAGGAAITAASLLAFGVEPWFIFFNAAGSARLLLEQGIAPWAKMTSLFAALRLLDVPVVAAWSLHGVWVGLAVAVSWPVLRRGGDLAIAALVFVTLSLAPYQFDYDQCLALVGLAFWLRGIQGPWLKGEQATLAGLWLAPLVLPLLAAHARVELMPFFVMAALVLLRKRALATLTPPAP